MYVLQVVPLSPTAPVSSLTYRSTVAFPRGALVSVPLRKSTVIGVVLESLSVREAKSLIKQATFELKKSDVVALGVLEEELLALLEVEAMRSGASPPIVGARAVRCAPISAWSAGLAMAHSGMR